MSKLAHVVKDAIGVLWGLALPIPMPWRASLIIVIAILALYHLGWRILSWSIEKLGSLFLFVIETIASLLLLPEYWLTRWLRLHNHKPIPGSYALGDILQSLVSFVHGGAERLAEARDQWRLRRIWLLVLLLASIPPLLWYVRSGLEDTTIAARYIDQAMSWWFSVERQVLSSG